jgi:NAD(P)-dependent dehydrogenase (short-subunit alcohol dehydrogenase family)
VTVPARVAIVTGGGQGIGRAYVRRLAGDGYAVIVADLNEERGRRVAEEVAGDVRFVRTDVSDAASCRAMAAAALEAHGRIDVLVNNAAIFSTIEMKPFWEIDETEWDALMAVNLKGVWLASTAVAAPMREAGAGSIVNVSSAAIYLARPNYAHYLAAKAGVIGLTRGMARELGPFGVRVNAITPGPVYTEIRRDTVTDDQRAAMRAATALGREAGPDDLVGAVAFLASADSGFMTGQTINVDGGLTFP